MTLLRLREDEVKALREIIGIIGYFLYLLYNVKMLLKEIMITGRKDR
jgi:hypothetical protein